MSQDAKNTALFFVSDVGDFDASIADWVETARRAFQDAYEASSAKVPREQFLNDLEKLEQAAEPLLKEDLGLADKYQVLIQTYIPLIDELKQRYSDFMPDEVSQRLTTLVMQPVAMYGLFEATSMMAYAMQNLQEPGEQFKVLYTGLVRASEVVEKYIQYYSVRTREEIRTIAVMFLSEPTFKPDQYVADHAVYGYVIGLKNTARSILWQLDNRPEATKYTVKGLLDWTETSRGWVGGDFEECLDYVNRARKG